MNFLHCILYDIKKRERLSRYSQDNVRNINKVEKNASRCLKDNE